MRRRWTECRRRNREFAVGAGRRAAHSPILTAVSAAESRDRGRGAEAIVVAADHDELVGREAGSGAEGGGVEGGRGVKGVGGTGGGGGARRAGGAGGAAGGVG